MRINDSLMVDWHHSPATKETVCQLINNDNKVISSGLAKAWHKDQFCKSKGRKIALTRALKESNLSKDQRTEIWSIIKQKGIKIYC